MKQPDETRAAGFADALWSAPAERSDDGAFERAGTSRNVNVSRAWQNGVANVGLKDGDGPLRDRLRLPPQSRTRAARFARRRGVRVVAPLLAVLLLLALAVGAQENARPAKSPPALHRLDPRTPAGLQKLLGFDGESLPLVAAHRGGPREGFPENCLATFEETLRHVYATMEIDPRLTKDGAIVLMHDPTLDRTSTGRGRVADHTLAELKQLRLKDTEGKVTAFQIPTLDEALEWARGKTVLVLDQKDAPLAARVRKIEEHKAEGYALLIVNTFKDAQACHALNSNLMMEVMIPTLAKAREFDALGIPWRNVIAFVGHTPPEDAALYEFIHRKGASCMIGTSRNLDRRVLTGEVTEIKSLELDYRAFLKRGADLIETDIPVPLGRLLHRSQTAPASKQALFIKP